MESTQVHHQQTSQEELPFHTEGQVKFLTRHITESAKGLEEETVFYNPVQVFNRDLSMLAIYEFCKMQSENNPEKFKGMRFYDALSASG